MHHHAWNAAIVDEHTPWAGIVPSYKDCQKLHAGCIQTPRTIQHTYWRLLSFLGSFCIQCFFLFSAASWMSRENANNGPSIEFSAACCMTEPRGFLRLEWHRTEVFGVQKWTLAFSFGLNNLTLPNPSLTPNIIKYSYIRKKSWEFKLLVGLVGLVGLCALHDVSNILYAVYATYGYVNRDHIYI